MFCGECGTKNTGGSQFCENCGAKLEQANVDANSTANQGNNTQQPNAVNTNQQINDNSQNQAMMQQPATPSKPMSPKTKLIIGIVTVLAVLLGGGYYYLGTLITPEKVAENYFNALMANDADKIYSFMSIEESKFTTKEMFKKVVKNTTKDQPKVEVVNYEVGKPKYDDLTKMTTKVTITYVLKDVEKSQTMDIKLTKAKDAKWLLYDNWQVSTAAYTEAKDFEIRVQPGSTVKIEGTKVDKKYLNEDLSSYSYDVYVIPSMFTGKYKIGLSLPIGLETEDLVSVSTESYYYPSISSSTLTKKSSAKLEKQVISDMQTIYDNAIAKTAFADIKSNFEFTDCDLGDLETTYNELVSDLAGASNTLTKIKFKKAELGSLYVDEDGEFSISVTVKSDYTVSYTDYSGEVKTHSDTESDYATLYYTYVDGAYKLTDASYLEYYFSRY